MKFFLFRQRNRQRGAAHSRAVALTTGVALLYVFLWLLMVGAVEAAQSGRFEVTLARTIDGDTARFFIEGAETRVRFLAVDAPEMGFGGGQREPGALEATRFVDQMLRQARVIELEIDPARPGTDRFGRLRAWVWADGVLVQEKLVRQGHAEVVFLDPGMLHYDRIRAAQAVAAPRVRSPVDTGSGLIQPVRGNRNSRVFHLPHCPSYDRIAPQNIVEFASEAEAIAAGFRRAGNC